MASLATPSPDKIVPRRIVSAVLVSLGLAAMIHTDWHFARPTHHSLSLGLPWHWLLAIPAFALVAWYVSRVWPAQVLRASVLIVGGAVIAGGVLEPAYEYCLEGATFDWAFGPARNAAAASYVGTGLISYLATLGVIRRRRSGPAG
jgi:hypothetical protein